MTATAVVSCLFLVLLCADCTAAFPFTRSATAGLASSRPVHARAAGPVTYTITELKWNNCNESAGLIVDALFYTIVDGDVIHVMQRFHTSVDLFTSVVSYNVTIATSGELINIHELLGMETLLLNSGLPIFAPASDIILSLVDMVDPDMSTEHIDEYTHYYDTDLQVVGCTHSQYNIVRNETANTHST